MNYNTLYKNFQYFVDHHDECMTEDQQQAALRAFQKPYNRRVFQLSIILMLWSIVGVTIDSFIIGGSVTAAVVNGPAWVQLLPTLIFSALNWLWKWIFVYFYLRREVPVWVAFMSGIQYVGFTFLLAHALKSDPEFRLGLSEYMKYLRRRRLFFLRNLFKKNNPS